MPDDLTPLMVPLVVLAALFLLILLALYVLHTKKISALNAIIDERARAQYQTWRERDYQTMVVQQSSVAQREAQVELNQWKIDNEAGIRQDAIARSRAVIVGKVTEHLVPHMPVFPYNPKDARFIGSPIDLIVFDGCDEGQIRDVVFLEIKTGTSSLSSRQRQIRDAIEGGHVVWRILKL
jgi:predicted Holliday junction resolvase-like endonuclease